MKTPLEESRKETINALQSIIEKNYDAEKGYKKAMQDAENPALRGFLQQQAAKRSHYATAIDQELRLLGEQPKESGSVTGSLHRAWIDIKSTVAGNTDEAVLEEVIRGEKASVEDYQEALRKPNLGPQINNVLQTQLNDIQSTLNKVKRLEDITS
ncbi:MAG TPA: PA2169 family four-helix-bundle protein [Flavobacteriaceae bacterium]|nr:PA2169 family four-helix-bundle protein [Flavobacteriaceae bacterium]